MAKFTQLFKEIQDNSITPIKTTFCGDLSSLETTAKDNLVNAINEVKNSSGGSSNGLIVDLLWEGSLSAGRDFSYNTATTITTLKDFNDYRYIYFINDDGEKTNIFIWKDNKIFSIAKPTYITISGSIAEIGMLIKGIRIKYVNSNSVTIAQTNVASYFIGTSTIEYTKNASDYYLSTFGYLTKIYGIK